MGPEVFVFIINIHISPFKEKSTTTFPRFADFKIIVRNTGHPPFNAARINAIASCE